MCGVTTAAISGRPAPVKSATPTGLSQRLAVPMAALSASGAMPSSPMRKTARAAPRRR